MSASDYERRSFWTYEMMDYMQKELKEASEKVAADMQKIIEDDFNRSHDQFMKHREIYKQLNNNQND